jgi:hypothetical protein
MPIALRQDHQNRAAVATGGEQHGRCDTGKTKYYRFYANSDKLILAVMYLQQVRVVGFSFAAVTAHISTVVTPPVSAAQNLATFFLRDFNNFVFLFLHEFIKRTGEDSHARGHAGTQARRHTGARVFSLAHSRTLLNSLIP